MAKLPDITGGHHLVRLPDYHMGFWTRQQDPLNLKLDDGWAESVEEQVILLLVSRQKIKYVL